ncbi:tetratricopeptide repeat protein [Candidatus Omnitrophota bacterium]
MNVTINTHRSIIVLISVVAILMFFNTYTSTWICDDIYWNIHAREASMPSAHMLLGDFAPIIADYLVINAHHYWHEGRWYLMPVVYSLIVRIQPTYIEYWSLLGWLYAFNNSVYVTDENKKNALIKEGLHALREGLAYHFNSYNLYFDIAWTYYKKQSDLSTAIIYCEKALAYPHPIKVERLMSISLFRLGQTKEAERVWEKYLEEHPHNSVALQELKKVKTLLSS